MIDLKTLFSEIPEHDLDELLKWCAEGRFSGASVRVFRNGYSVELVKQSIQANSTREGELCWVRDGEVCDVPQYWSRARLLKWSQNFKEFESGPAAYPVGLIELIETGQVYAAAVSVISFAVECPGEVLSRKKGG